MSCTSGSTDAIEETVAASSSTLTYDATTNRYQYTWKTDKATMAGKCVQLDLKFVDGHTYSADFKLK
jgi:hypothetical protein